MGNAENVLCDGEALNGNKIPFDRMPFEVHVSPKGDTCTLVWRNYLVKAAGRKKFLHN